MFSFSTELCSINLTVNNVTGREGQTVMCPKMTYSPWKVSCLESNRLLYFYNNITLSEKSQINFTHTLTNVIVVLGTLETILDKIHNRPIS